MSRLILPHTADRAAWLTARQDGIGASEIAAVMGISPWESPFSLWWRKREGWRVDANDEMRVGAFLEDTIADWFAECSDPLDNLAIVRAGLYAHDARLWQIATPDRVIYQRCAACEPPWVPQDSAGCYECRNTQCGGPPLAVLECKWAAASWDGWGPDGSDQIPVYYRAQVQWQMDVMDVPEAFVCALGPGGFRIYRVRRDERDLEVMREAGRRFMASLEADTPPDIDEHAATADTLRRLHPSIDDIDIQVDVEFAEGYRRARQLAKRASKLVDRYDNRARDLLGDARRLMCGSRLVVSRSVYDQSGDGAELTALETDWPTVDRLNPGRAASYAD